MHAAVGGTAASTIIHAYIYRERDLVRWLCNVDVTTIL